MAKASPNSAHRRFLPDTDFHLHMEQRVVPCGRLGNLWLELCLLCAMELPQQGDNLSPPPSVVPDCGAIPILGVPVYVAAVCECCLAPTFEPACLRCDHHVCGQCWLRHRHWCSINAGAVLCSQCGVPACLGSCSSCGLAVCKGCLDAHMCATQSSSDDFEDSPRGEVPSQPTPVAETDGPEEMDDGPEEMDACALISGAWDCASPAQLKKKLWVRIAGLPALEDFDDGVLQRGFGTCADDFQRVAEEIAWDVPGGLVLLHIDRKKALVFSAGRAYPAAAFIDSALAWSRQSGALGLAIRTRSDKLEVGLFEVLYCPGQSDRLPVYRTILIAAIRSQGYIAR